MENGKTWKGAIQRKQVCLAFTYPYEQKSKLPKLAKLIDLDQNTNQGHPCNNIKVCPVTPVKLWRTGVQWRGKGMGRREVRTKDE